MLILLTFRLSSVIAVVDQILEVAYHFLNALFDELTLGDRLEGVQEFHNLRLVFHLAELPAAGAGHSSYLMVYNINSP